MSDRRTAGAILGSLTLALLAVLWLGGAAARPRGLWLGTPGAFALLGVGVGLGAAWMIWRGRLSLGLGMAPVVLALLLGLPLPGVAAVSGPVLLPMLLAVLVLLLAQTPPRLPRALVLPAIFILYAAAAARTQQQVGPEGDEPHYLMVAESLLSDHDLSLESDYTQQRYLAFHDAPLEPHYRVRGKHGEIYSLHAVGLSLLILPAYALGGYPGASLFMALLAALLAGEVRGAVNESLGDEGVAEAAGWITALSPPLLHYAGLIFTEVPAALLVAFALRRKKGLAAGFALALLPWLNVRYAALTVVLLAYGLWHSGEWKERLRLVLPSLASAAGSALYHYWLYGFYDPRRVYGRRPEFSLATLPEGLPGLFLDQEFGLFVYAPVLALALPGFFRLFGRDRPRALAATALVVVAVVTSATWHMWRGGWNPPGRFLVPVLPALALLAAGALGGGLRAGAALLVGWSLWTGLAGAAQPRLVHRDRDGTAPFFRALSGAEEWTRLLPGYVLGEPDRHRLAFVWMGAILLAVPWRRGRATAPRLALATTGLLAAAGVASSLSDARTGGRDAVRLVGRSALAVPGWSWTPKAAAEWGKEQLDWGPLFEPHRHPEGVELGSRLRLPPGAYELRIEAERLNANAPRLELWSDPPRAVGRSVVLVQTEQGWSARFTVAPGDGPLTLRLRGGGPFLLQRVWLEAQPWPADSGQRAVETGRTVR